eukprot:2309757-Pleurochrysis_carterae.AAC.1
MTDNSADADEEAAYDAEARAATTAALTWLKRDSVAVQMYVVPKKELKTSSVNRVQYRIICAALAIDARHMKSDVHRPTHPYIGRKGTPSGDAHAYSAVVKVSVRPVGPMNVIG